ncbi:MAG: hypothetical protein IJ955_06950 [Oscillospiraceae bacterium]|nr:hypothetical protein [Oscillospiraceae bacterium]
MSKAVLISIHPKWCKLISEGKKIIEVRKNRPKLKTPFKCYIYQTKKGKVGTGLFTADGEIMGRSVKNGMVIGEFICDRIFELAPTNHAPDNVESLSCMTREEIVTYIKGIGYGWHISDILIYDKPKELSEFIPNCQYVQEGACEGLKKVDCPFQKRDYNPDGSVNIVSCANRVSRSPQSWCYVEEVW